MKEMILSVTTMVYSNGILLTAAYGQNAANWLLEQLFWVALVVFAVGIIAMAAKKNLTGALVLFLVGALVLAFIKNPTLMSDTGNKIADIVFK